VRNAQLKILFARRSWQVVSAEAEDTQRPIRPKRPSSLVLHFDPGSAASQAAGCIPA